MSRRKIEIAGEMNQESKPCSPNSSFAVANRAIQDIGRGTSIPLIGILPLGPAVERSE